MTTHQILPFAFLAVVAVLVLIQWAYYRNRRRLSAMAAQDRDKRFLLLPHHKAKIDVTVVKDGECCIASITVLKPGYVFDTPTRAPFTTVYPDN